jgi:stage III sporulation protein AF
MAGGWWQWVRTLLVVVLLGNLADFLIPKSDLKRYVGLVVGLVILAVMVEPLWSWMHALKSPEALANTPWTNTPTGFQQVTLQEELRQAQAIVLTYPGVKSCRIEMVAPNHFVARVTLFSSEKSTATLIRYVASAIQVTTGHSARVHVVISQA